MTLNRYGQSTLVDTPMCPNCGFLNMELAGQWFLCPRCKHREDTSCQCPRCAPMPREDAVAEYVFKTAHLPREDVFRMGKVDVWPPPHAPGDPGPFMLRTDLPPPPTSVAEMEAQVEKVLDLISTIRMSQNNRFLHIGPAGWALVEPQLELHPGFNHTPHGVIQIMTPGWVNVVIVPHLDADPLNLGHPTTMRWHFSQNWECGPACR